MTAATAPEHRVVILAYQGVQALDVTGPFEVFAGATTALEAKGELAGSRPPYRVALQAPTPGPVRSESGLTLFAEPIDAEPIGTLVVPGGNGVWAAIEDPAFVELVRAAAGRATRVVSVCTGAFLLAAAGILSGRTATTHWARAPRLAREHPDVVVEADRIWVRDGDVWTSAGVTAGIDVALAVVEHDHGVDVAETVARWLVVFLRRAGGQSQFAAPVWRTRARFEPVRRAQELIDADPGGDHRVPALAAKVAMSERHFLRRFTEEVGVTPARYVAQARVDAARRQLEASDESVTSIADRVGFGTAETMRRTFMRQIGAAPDHYRRRFTHRP
jgi:transcriptional regulator GlxA family with amidase domain